MESLQHIALNRATHEAPHRRSSVSLVPAFFLLFFNLPLQCFQDLWTWIPSSLLHSLASDPSPSRKSDLIQEDLKELPDTEQSL